MILKPILCLAYQQPASFCIHGKATDRTQRYRCTACRRTFQLRYRHKIHEAGVRARITDLALNGSGIRDTARVLAFVLGWRTHATFRRMRLLLAGLGQAVVHWFTDAWWAYADELDPATRTEGKAALQRLERKHLTLRTRLKHLAHKTICFSKKQFFHNGLIALFIFYFFL